MKYVKIILGIIVLLIVIFFGNGLLNPTFSYDNQVNVDKPVEEVWFTMADPSKMSEWLPGFIKIEHVSGMPGMAGSVSNVYFEENGEEVVMEETIVENVPNERMAMIFKADFLDMDYQVSFREENNMTVIETNTVVKGNGLFAQSMLSFMKGMMHDQEDENLNSLKNLAERE